MAARRFNLFSEDSYVTIEFPGSYPLSDQSFCFKFNCGSEWSAKLLERNLRQSINSNIMEIRKRAYNKGYMDHKTKTKKETYFPDCLNELNMPE